MKNFNTQIIIDYFNIMFNDQEKRAKEKLISSDLNNLIITKD